MSYRDINGQISTEQQGCKTHHHGVVLTHGGLTPTLQSQGIGDDRKLKRKLGTEHDELDECIQLPEGTENSRVIQTCECSRSIRCWRWFVCNVGCVLCQLSFSNPVHEANSDREP